MNNCVLIKSFEAEGDIAGSRFVSIKNSSCVCQADGSRQIIGISDCFGADHGGMADVILSGIAEAECAGPIECGSAVGANQFGQAIVTQGAAAGIALTGTTSAGEMVSVLLGCSQTSISPAYEKQPVTINNEQVLYDTEAQAFILAHHPVVPDSLILKSADGGTTYVFNTDYSVNLQTGAITSVDGTSISFAENSTLSASYQYNN